MLPKLPKAALDVISAIEKAGGLGFVVGGALRDLMMGRYPSDWDFAATLPPEKLLEIFPQSRNIGGHCGTVKVKTGRNSCEITPCRIEKEYSDYRHPDKVTYVGDIFLDLARRDFTMNAMAYNGKVLIDPYGGQFDIQNHVVRCVGNPVQRFREDPLRVMRMYRFCATLGFTAEWNTAKAAGANSRLVSELSPERVRCEMRHILLSPRPQMLGPLIRHGGLSRYGFVYAPPLDPLAEVPEVELYRWWALTRLCHVDIDESSGRLGFSKRSVQKMKELTRMYRDGPALNRVQLKEKMSRLRFDYATAAATFKAMSAEYTEELMMVASITANHEPYTLQDLAISGETLIKEGLSGEQCGHMLEYLLSEVIRKPQINDEEMLLNMVRAMRDNPA